MRIEYRAARDQDELEDSAVCSYRAFGNRNGEFFRTIVKYDPWFDLENTRACFLDGRVVSVVQTFERPIRVGDCVVRMGGLGSVGTDPEFQRMGYSAEVLKDSIRYMEDKGYDLSILGAAVLSHYARLGWVVCPTYSFSVRIPEALPEARAGLKVEAFDPDRHLPEVMAIYDLCNARRTGTLVRTRAYWQERPKWRKNDPFRVVTRNGRVVAYAATRPREVREFGFLPEHGDAMQALFLVFFRETRAEGAAEVQVRMPHEWRWVLEDMGCGMRRREASGKMVRIIRFESLVRKIAPLLEARLRASDCAGWEGRVRVRYEAGEQTVAVKAGRISVARGRRKPDLDLVVSQEQLVKLLFGRIEPEQVAFSNHLPLEERDIAFLDALFPQDELFMWQTDAY